MSQALEAVLSQAREFLGDRLSTNADRREQHRQAQLLPEEGGGGIEAADVARDSTERNSDMSSDSAISARASSPSTTASTSLCMPTNAEANSSPYTSRREAMNCPTLMYVGPSSVRRRANQRPVAARATSASEGGFLEADRVREPSCRAVCTTRMWRAAPSIGD